MAMLKPKGIAERLGVTVRTYKFRKGKIYSF